MLRHCSLPPEPVPAGSLIDTQYALAHQRCIEEMQEILTLVTNKEDYRQQPLFVSKKLRSFFAAAKSINHEQLDTLRSIVRAMRPSSDADAAHLTLVDQALGQMIVRSNLVLDDMHARTSRDAITAFNDPYKDCPCPPCARFLGVTASVCCCGGCGCHCCITYCCPSARALTCTLL